MGKVTQKDIEDFVFERNIRILFTEDKTSNDHLRTLLIMQMMNQEEMSPTHRIVSCELKIKPQVSEKAKRVLKAYEELGKRWERYQAGTKNYYPEDMEEEDLLRDIRSFSEIKRGIKLS